MGRRKSYSTTHWYGGARWWRLHACLWVQQLESVHWDIGQTGDNRRSPTYPARYCALCYCNKLLSCCSWGLANLAAGLSPVWTVVSVIHCTGTVEIIYCNRSRYSCITALTPHKVYRNIGVVQARACSHCKSTKLCEVYVLRSMGEHLRKVNAFVVC